MEAEDAELNNTNEEMSLVEEPVQENDQKVPEICLQEDEVTNECDLKDQNDKNTVTKDLTKTSLRDKRSVSPLSFLKEDFSQFREDVLKVFRDKDANQSSQAASTHDPLKNDSSQFKEDVASVFKSTDPKSSQSAEKTINRLSFLNFKDNVANVFRLGPSKERDNKGVTAKEDSSNTFKIKASSDIFTLSPSKERDSTDTFKIKAERTTDAPFLQSLFRKTSQKVESGTGVKKIMSETSEQTKEEMDAGFKGNVSEQNEETVDGEKVNDNLKDGTDEVEVAETTSVSETQHSEETIDRLSFLNCKDNVSNVFRLGPSKERDHKGVTAKEDSSHAFKMKAERTEEPFLQSLFRKTSQKAESGTDDKEIFSETSEQTKEEMDASFKENVSEKNEETFDGEKVNDNLKDGMNEVEVAETTSLSETQHGEETINRLSFLNFKDNVSNVFRLGPSKKRDHKGITAKEDSSNAFKIKAERAESLFRKTSQKVENGPEDKKIFSETSEQTKEEMDAGFKGNVLEQNEETVDAGKVNNKLKDGMNEVEVAETTSVSETQHSEETINRLSFLNFKDNVSNVFRLGPSKERDHKGVTVKEDSSNSFKIKAERTDRPFLQSLSRKTSQKAENGPDNKKLFSETSQFAGFKGNVTEQNEETVDAFKIKAERAEEPFLQSLFRKTSQKAESGTDDKEIFSETSEQTKEEMDAGFKENVSEQNEETVDAGKVNDNLKDVMNEVEVAETTSLSETQHGEETINRLSFLNFKDNVSNVFRLSPSKERDHKGIRAKEDTSNAFKIKAERAESLFRKTSQKVENGPEDKKIFSETSEQTKEEMDTGFKGNVSEQNEEIVDAGKVTNNLQDGINEVEVAETTSVSETQHGEETINRLSFLNFKDNISNVFRLGPSKEQDHKGVTVKEDSSNAFKMKAERTDRPFLQSLFRKTSQKAENGPDNKKLFSETSQFAGFKGNVPEQNEETVDGFKVKAERAEEPFLPSLFRKTSQKAESGTDDKEIFSETSEQTKEEMDAGFKENVSEQNEETVDAGKVNDNLKDVMNEVEVAETTSLSETQHGEETINRLSFLNFKDNVSNVFRLSPSKERDHKGIRAKEDTSNAFKIKAERAESLFRKTSQKVENGPEDKKIFSETSEQTKEEMDTGFKGNVSEQNEEIVDAGKVTNNLQDGINEVEVAETTSVSETQHGEETINRLSFLNFKDNISNVFRLGPSKEQDHKGVTVKEDSSNAFKMKAERTDRPFLQSLFRKTSQKAENGPDNKKLFSETSQFAGFKGNVPEQNEETVDGFKVKAERAEEPFLPSLFRKTSQKAESGTDDKEIFSETSEQTKEEMDATFKENVSEQNEETVDAEKVNDHFKDRTNEVEVAETTSVSETQHSEETINRVSFLNFKDVSNVFRLSPSKERDHKGVTAKEDSSNAFKIKVERAEEPFLQSLFRKTSQKAENGPDDEKIFSETSQFAGFKGNVLEQNDETVDASKIKAERTDSLFLQSLFKTSQKVESGTEIKKIMSETSAQTKEEMDASCKGNLLEQSEETVDGAKVNDNLKDGMNEVEVAEPRSLSETQHGEETINPPSFLNFKDVFRLGPSKERDNKGVTAKEDSHNAFKITASSDVLRLSPSKERDNKGVTAKEDSHNAFKIKASSDVFRLSPSKERDKGVTAKEDSSNAFKMKAERVDKHFLQSLFRKTSQKAENGPDDKKLFSETSQFAGVKGNVLEQNEEAVDAEKINHNLKDGMKEMEVAETTSLSETQHGEEMIPPSQAAEQRCESEQSSDGCSAESADDERINKDEAEEKPSGTLPLQPPSSEITLFSLRDSDQDNMRGRPGGNSWSVKNFACYLTFDPNTANSELRLSNSNRKVTREWAELWLPEHLDRFKRCPQVLCREALLDSAYWEAEWNGGADIGVTYNDICRDGDAARCLLGHNERSWSLECSEGSYTPCHANRRFRAVAPRPFAHRVGVHLDWSAGTLSFYCVSQDAMVHLHTFRDTFTQPLYPAFWVWASGGAVLLSQVVLDWERLLQ